MKKIGKIWFFYMDKNEKRKGHAYEIANPKEYHR